MDLHIFQTYQPWKCNLMRALLATCLASIPSAHAAMLGSERAALLDIYFDTNGDGWAVRDGWNGPNGTECTWFGITCDASASSVIAIDLDNNLLTGSLPPLNGLPSLQYFNVGNDGNHDSHFANLVSGTLPALSDLHNLQVFIANGQNFTGELPSLSGSPNLTRFEVPRNRLTGYIPDISSLSHLTYFDVGFNQLTGSLPDIRNLATITLFRAGQNQLTGSIPSLAMLTDLVDFDVSGNHLTGTLPALAGLSKLSSFFAGNNQLTGEIPSLSGLVSMTSFGVGANRLTGGVPDLSSWPQMKQFLIYGNQLSGTMPAPPAQFTAYSASLCPNQLDPASNPPSAVDLAWNTATGVDPWSQRCSQNPAATLMTVRSATNPSYTGQTVLFTASVYGGFSPTGSVTFSTNEAVLCGNVPLTNGVASCERSDLPAGTSNVITAAYSGDASNSPSSDSSLDQLVFYNISEATTGNPLQVGQPTDLIARISGARATDTATFFDGLSPLCSNVPLVMVDGKLQGHCVTAFNRVGDHSITIRDDQAGIGGFSDVPMIQRVVAGSAIDANQFALTGSWFNPATSGQGLTIEVYPDFVASGTGLLAGGWFTYDTSGNPRWLYLQGDMNSAHGSTYALGVYTSSGGAFDAPPTGTTLSYGSATMTFYDCSHASLVYAFDDGRSGTIPYVRLTRPSACSTAVPATTPQNLPPNYNDVLHAGNWFNPSTSGQGLMIDVVPAQSVFVMTWYTYAPQSEGLSGDSAKRWFSIQSSYVPGTLNLMGLPIYAPRGGIFNDPTPISFSQVGLLDANFTSCNTMTLHYAFTSGEFAGHSGTIEEQTISPVATCQQ